MLSRSTRAFGDQPACTAAAFAASVRQHIDIDQFAGALSDLGFKTTLYVPRRGAMNKSLHTLSLIAALVVTDADVFSDKDYVAHLNIDPLIADLGLGYCFRQE